MSLHLQCGDLRRIFNVAFRTLVDRQRDAELDLIRHAQFGRDDQVLKARAEVEDTVRQRASLAALSNATRDMVNEQILLDHIQRALVEIETQDPGTVVHQKVSGQPQDLHD